MQITLQLVIVEDWTTEYYDGHRMIKHDYHLNELKRLTMMKCSRKAAAVAAVLWKQVVFYHSCALLQFDIANWYNHYDTTNMVWMLQKM